MGMDMNQLFSMMSMFGMGGNNNNNNNNFNNLANLANLFTNNSNNNSNNGGMDQLMKVGNMLNKLPTDEQVSVVNNFINDLTDAVNKMEGR